MDNDPTSEEHDDENSMHEDWHVCADHLFLQIEKMLEEGYTNMDLIRALSFVLCDISQEEN
jgi:hypothetical protein